MSFLEKGQKNGFPSVYFIENHIDTSPSSISISSEFIQVALNDVMHEDKQKNNEKYILTLYQFEIDPKKIKDRDKKEIDIKIELTVHRSKEIKFIFEAKLTEFDIDNFIYDLKFEEKGKRIKREPPKSLKLTHLEQFEIYKKYLINVLNKTVIGDKERKDLVASTHKLFLENFTFNFYLSIFLDCTPVEVKIKHILCFDPKKMKGIDKKEINELLNNAKKRIDAHKKKICPVKFLINLMIKNRKMNVE